MKTLKLVKLGLVLVAIFTFAACEETVEPLNGDGDSQVILPDFD